MSREGGLLRLAGAALVLCLLISGCSLLEREYRVVTPHSHSYWEDADKNALRVSGGQELVNALLLLVENRQETVRVHLSEEDASSVQARLEAARDELFQEIPAGAYALEDVAWTTQAQRDYWEVELTLTYRRTAEEEDAIIDASSSNAVYDLIPFALEEQRQCLAVRFARLEQSPEELVAGILDLQYPAEEQVPEGEGTADDETLSVDPPEDPEAPSAEEESPSEETEQQAPPWQVCLYPDNENAGIVEILFWE